MGSRRQHLFAQGEHGDDGFDSPGGAELVTVHRLGRADRQPRSTFAEYRAQGRHFNRITFGRRRAMGINVVDVAGSQAGIRERSLQRAHLSGCFRAQGPTRPHRGPDRYGRH